MSSGGLSRVHLHLGPSQPLGLSVRSVSEGPRVENGVTDAKLTIHKCDVEINYNEVVVWFTFYRTNGQSYVMLAYDVCDMQCDDVRSAAYSWWCSLIM